MTTPKGPHRMNLNDVIYEAQTDAAAWDPVLKEHLIHSKMVVSLGAERLFRDFTAGFTLTEEFLTYLFALIGMEIEGEEVSVGFLYCNGSTPRIVSRLPNAKLGRWIADRGTYKNQRGEEEELNLGSTEFADYRRIIRKIRAELIGWCSGRLLEPLLVLGGVSPMPQIRGLKLLGSSEASEADGLWNGLPPVTDHQVYKKITASAPRTLAIWVKPAATIRLYRGGQLFGQIMRLRDAGGWTTRQIDRLVEITYRVLRFVGVRMSRAMCRQMLIVPAVTMSEMRRGCAIAVMEAAIFRRLKAGDKYGCKAAHEPTAEEHQVPPGEREYETYLSQDGTVVINHRGRLLGAGVYFKGGPGGRRSTAAWLPTIIRNCVSLVTSQDGPIYLFWPTRPGKGIAARKGAGRGIRLDFIARGDSKGIESEWEA